MLKQLLIVVVVLAKACLVSMPGAVDIDSDKWNISQSVEYYKFDNSSQGFSTNTKTSKDGLDEMYVAAPSRCESCHEAEGVDNQLIGKVNNSDASCDWCHSDGSASSYLVSIERDEDIQADPVSGHIRGYGLESGKWKSPDDTYPAFTPRFWRGGMSCFDCHPAHTCPGQSFNHAVSSESFNGVESINTDFNAKLKNNPDHEIDEKTGAEITDSYVGNYSDTIPHPTNKVEIGWGDSQAKQPDGSSKMDLLYRKLNEFCVDCHDGNAGDHNLTALIYSEKQAIDGKIGLDSYVEARGHDVQIKQHIEKTKFNLKDGHNNGPDCITCHSGNSDCDICHASFKLSKAKWPKGNYIINSKIRDKSTQSGVNCSPQCINLGFSWPHKTMAWKMLKDELFGANLYSQNKIEVGQARDADIITANALNADNQETDDPHLNIPSYLAEDLDSVCLDCHNPTTWKPKAEESFERGLP